MGNLFIPFKGEKVDGHQFVEQAIEQGAHASLWQKDVPNPPLHLPILVVKDVLYSSSGVSWNVTGMNWILRWLE